MLIRLFKKMFDPKSLNDLTPFQRWIWLSIDWEEADMIDHRYSTNWEVQRVLGVKILADSSGTRSSSQ